MRRPIKLCACGCGAPTKRNREYLAGHDQILRLALEDVMGGLLTLRSLVERTTSREAVRSAVMARHEAREARKRESQ